MPSELKPSQLLTQLSHDHSTGCLEITHGSVIWHVFLRSGQLVNVDCSSQSLEKLMKRLQQLGYVAAAAAVKTAPPSNLLTDSLVRQELDNLAHQGLLDREQLHHITLESTKEDLESLLWLTEGDTKWHQNRQMPTTAVSNAQSSLNLLALLNYYQQRLQIWQKFITVVQSPHQRPCLTAENILEKTVPGGTLSTTALQQIAQLMRGISLRELALLLKQDELKLVQLLVPYIRHNLIFLRPPSAPFNALPTIPEPPLLPLHLDGDSAPIDRESHSATNKSKIYQIACIDDSPLILDEIERFLGTGGKYQLTKLQEPIKASSTIFRLKPDLILMDITMPNINGYKLCSLFRSSAALATTPIIMVTGNKSLVDQVRAKLVGATDYLTKPFTKQELTAIIEKHLT
jgi:two-component system, chemotaxis family, response regulator PixG